MLRNPDELLVFTHSSGVLLFVGTNDLCVDRGGGDVGVAQRALYQIGRKERPAIPPLRHEAPVACPDWIYNNRNQVERLWAKLKEWLAIATRYEKTATSSMSVLCLAAALDSLKR